MRPETRAEQQRRNFAAVDKLRPLGFRPLGGMMSMKDGVSYDLSAADLDRIDRIEREGLFVIPADEVHDRILALGSR
jgi:hypothetical protein